MAIRELVVGGGCFWCLEAQFKMLNGVDDVLSGYANGELTDPDYRAVCSGDSGHAEVVKIKYNDSIISTYDLLEIFFEIHDPTTLNSQGADIGTQYRSVILYEDENTKNSAVRAMKSAQKIYRDPIVTLIEPLDKFYIAEDYHQDYYIQNMMQGYCMAVISPKVTKMMQNYSDKVNKSIS